MRRRHSSLQSNEPANDWFSDALTPKRLRRQPPPTMDDLLPVEEDEEVESEVIAKQTTLAIHMTLEQLYEREMVV